MADKKISALTSATTPLAGTEVLPIVQGASTVKVAVSDLTAGRAVSATSVAAGLGLVGTPAYTFTGDLNTGMWSPAADTVAVSTAGLERTRITSDGTLLKGYTIPVTNLFGVGFQVHGTGGDAAFSQTRWTAGVGSPTHYLSKSRGASPGTRGAVVANDFVGEINFTADDGTNFVSAALISAAIDGTPGTNDMPGRLLFSTTADGASGPSERMRLDTSGNLGLGTTAPTTGSTSNTATLNAGIFITARGAISATSGVATTISVANSSNNVTYIVSCGVAAGDPVNYNAVAIVSGDAGVFRVTALQTAPLMAITVSGTNIQATQTSGGIQPIQFCITRVS